MTLAPRLSLITLGVADLARSTEFYEALGFPRGNKAAEGVSFFQLGGLVLALYPRDMMARDAGLPEPLSAVAGISLAHNVESRERVDAVTAHAVHCGATLVKAPHDVFWGGYIAYISDPDGYLWEVAWNPDFALDENGNVHLPD